MISFLDQFSRVSETFLRVSAGVSDPDIFAKRSRLGRYTRWFSSCVVCESGVPPIDYLCAGCWREFGDIMNRGDELKQDYVLPTYSLITWTPQNESFVRPFIYGFKGGWRANAASKCAEIFLSEMMLANFLAPPSACGSAGVALESPSLISAPSERFDHSRVWSNALAQKLKSTETATPLKEKLTGQVSQKQLRQGERGMRRYEIREDFAGWPRASRRYVFADDVVTSGSTAMAAYMALGDPDVFEVWSLVSRPRLAAKVGFC